MSAHVEIKTLRGTAQERPLTQPMVHPACIASHRLLASFEARFR